mgnify:CR=1 FL=1
MGTNAPAPHWKVALAAAAIGARWLAGVAVFSAFSGAAVWVCLLVIHQANEQIAAIGYIESVILAMAIWFAILIFRAIKAAVPFIRKPGERGSVAATGSDYSGWNRPLMVHLTATSNEYLTGKLPVRGLLMVHEMDTKGFAQKRKVSFHRMGEDGKPVGGPVHVDDAEFAYTLSPPPIPSTE